MVVAAGGAAALSLGNPQGTVVLGRPLDLVFDVRTDGTDVSDACVTAKVTAGDDPISQSQISVTPLPNAAGRSASVRLRSSQPINEPVIDVRLSAGCSGSVVRTYTVLAYPAEALSASQASAERTSAAAAPLVLRSTLTPDAAGARDGVRTRSGAVPADQVVTQRSSRVERAVKPAVARKPELEPGRPRLVMEPLSDWLQAPSVLRASTEMAALPESTSPSLREEAAARWRALNMQSEDLLQEDARRAAQDKAQSEKLAAAERDKEAALAVQQEFQERAAARFPANLFESYAVTLVAALILGSVAFGSQGLVFPLLVPAIGAVTAIIGVFITKVRPGENALKAINRGFYTSAAISAVLAAIAAFVYLPDTFAKLDGVGPEIAAVGGNPRLIAMAAVIIGIVLAGVILWLTGHFTGTHARPTRDVARTSLTGPATVVLSGIGVGLESAVYTAAIIGLAVYLAFLLGGGSLAVALFLVALAGCGLPDDDEDAEALEAVRAHE